MTAWHRRTAIEVANRILATVRERAVAEGLDSSRLPPFFHGASARIAWIRNTLLVAFDDAPTDQLKVMGSVRADTSLLAEIPDAMPTRCFMPIKPGLKQLTLAQWKGHSSFVAVFPLGTMFTDCGYGIDQGPVLLLDVSFELEDAPSRTPLQRRLVPLALYILAADALPTSSTWQWLGDKAVAYYSDIATSSLGDKYAARHLRTRTFTIAPTTSVLVLGSYKPDRRTELESLRDALEVSGYSADLIEDLPDTPHTDFETKVRSWTLFARFCVLVDLEPSGHLIELPILTQQRTITAVLRRHGQPSTAMLTTVPSQDYTFIRAFSYDTSPLEALGQCIQWAEAQYASRHSPR